MKCTQCDEMHTRQDPTVCAQDVSNQCHTWMSHVTCEWVMSHMNESCHVWMSHVTYDWIMSHMNESCCVCTRLFQTKGDMADLYVIRLNNLRHDSFVCDMTYSYVLWLIYMWHDSFVCDMTHSCVPWLIHMWHASFICDMTHYHTRLYQTRFYHSYELFVRVTWLILVWDMTHLCVGHDSFGVHDGIKLDYLMRHIHTYDMTDLFVGRYLYVCWTWLTDAWDMIHSVCQTAWN